MSDQMQNKDLAAETAGGPQLLRPDFRRAGLVILLIVIGFWALIGAFGIYAALFWKDHKILETTPAQWVCWLLAYGAFLQLSVSFHLWRTDERSG